MLFAIKIFRMLNRASRVIFRITELANKFLLNKTIKILLAVFEHFNTCFTNDITIISQWGIFRITPVSRNKTMTMESISNIIIKFLNIITLNRQ
ncbi:MAG: hypothetical protein PWQ34_950 [Caldanaerobacter sp.]|nr:hypothetical protein [Caldanaerobacter sp.]